MHDRGGPALDEGVWGVRIVFQYTDLRGPAYLCHASDLTHAEHMAGRLRGQSEHAGGYDIYRLSERADDASRLALGDALKISGRRWAELFPG
jgi:hypothetical protein